jgi:hypothetical protein
MTACEPISASILATLKTLALVLAGIGFLFR